MRLNLPHPLLPPQPTCAPAPSGRRTPAAPVWHLGVLASALLAAGCSTLAPASGAGQATPAAAAAIPASAGASGPIPSLLAAAAKPSGSASAPTGSRPGAATPPPAPGEPPPFDKVIKDAKKIDGLFTAWQKDEKVWFELRPEDFDKPFFLSPKLTQGIGEGMFFGGLMLPSPRLVQWHRVHKLVQLVAINTQQVASAGTPEARAVAAAISNSLMAAVPVASAEHPERKTVLIDASGVFVGDMLGLAGRLQRSYRQNYSFEGRNSVVTAVRGKPELTVLEVTNHYATASINVPTPGGPPTPPGTPVPSTPDGLPDPRSMLLGVHYSLAKLPEVPMHARPADPRVGYFLSRTDNFSDDLARSPRQRFVNRWRLEKKDQSAALSEPVKPITYWLDRNVPLKYRAVITAGILEWNNAFEAIGFKNAIEVKQQPDDADWDTLDAGIASLRWMVNREPVFGAIGPSHVDPRTGEILDADIGMESLSSRNVRGLRARILDASGPAAMDREWARLMQLGGSASAGQPHAHDGHGDAACQQADLAAEQLAYGLELLNAGGEIDPDGPEARQFVLDYLKDVTMHEVGHTLGLRHNFRASHVYSNRQLSDPAFTREHALTGSVMEYAPINLAAPGQPAPAAFQSTLGPYDYWAIAYAYQPFNAADEAAGLARIAARSGEPELAFGTDEDNSLGIDPDTLHMDLGDDPVAFAQRRFEIMADLFKRQETRQLKPGEDYAGLRRSLLYASRDAGRATGVLLRQIGGLRTLRDFANTGRDPLQPVPAATQRAALALIAQRVLAADSFVLSPALQRRLAPDYFERADEVSGMATTLSLSDSLLSLQRTLLGQLLSDGLAQRVLANEGRVAPGEDKLRLAELYQQLDSAVWAELASGQAISSPRRALQREHVNRLTAMTLKPSPSAPADARALLRQNAQALLARLQRGQKRAGLDADSRLHLQDSAESLQLALSARVDRAAP